MVSTAIMVLMAIAVLNYLLHRDPIYPGFLQAAVWLLVLSFFVLNQNAFIPVVSAVYWLILGGVAAFSAGSLLATFAHEPHLRRTCIRSLGAPKNGSLVLFLLVAAGGLAFFALKAMDLSLSGPFANAFANLRYGASVGKEETGGFGLLAYFLPLSYSVAGAAVLKGCGLDARLRPSRGLVAASVLVALAYGALSSGRGFVVTLMVLLTGILLVLRVARPRVAVVMLGVLTCAVFYVGGILVGKGGSLDDPMSENIASMYDSAVVYAAGSIPALSSYLVYDSNRDLEYGRNTFRLGYSIAHAINPDVEVPPLVQEFTYVPMATNLYTVYRPYIRDFGYFGAIFAQLLFGAFHGFLYKRATVENPKSIYVFLFAVFLVPLISQFGQDMYLSMASTWVQYLFYAALLFAVFCERRDDCASTEGGHSYRQLEFGQTAV